MERRIVNPWSWQDQFGFVQANELSDFERVIVCSGQTSVDADGQSLHVDEFIAAGQQYGARLAEAGCRPTSTLLGVTRLAMPQLLVEIEATAAK